MQADPDQSDDQRLSALCRALGHPVRVQIVRYIQRHPGCIGNQILVNLPGPHRAQSTLSQHLKVLRDAGLIEAAPDGPATAYWLSAIGVAWLCEQLGAIERSGEAQPEKLVVHRRG